MKYYVIAYKYSRFRNVINLGDDMQSLAIEDMLKQLSIEEEQLDYIARSEMGVSVFMRASPRRTRLRTSGR